MSDTTDVKKDPAVEEVEVHGEAEVVKTGLAGE